MTLALLGIGCVVTSAVLAGCGSILEGEPDTGAGNGAPGPGSYEHPTGSQDVLVSVDRVGGRYGSVRDVLRNTAELLLLGDGTVIFPGAVDEPYPGTAIFPLQSTTLTEEQIQALFAAADEAGLLGESIDYGEPGIADQETTYVDITVDGRTVSQTVYALDRERNDANLSAASRAARAALSEFLITHSQNSGNGPFYQPDAVLAYRLPTSTGPPVEPVNEQEPRTWPIPTVPPPVAESSPNSCVAITGQEAADLLVALDEANELTPWLIGTQPPAQLVFRPLLPGDPGCEQ